VAAPVALAALGEQLDQFGGVAFLVSVADEGTPHTVSVTVAWDGEELMSGAGGRTSANVQQRPAVTLLWSARPGEPYSLIVDGTARVQAGANGAQVVAIRPTGDVLHRLAGADPALPSCVRLLSD
jgi:hypothetical protein